MIIETNSSSLAYNTFGIDVDFQSLIKIRDRIDLHRLMALDSFKAAKVLGGGSNVLLTRNIEEPVLLMENEGIRVIAETDSDVLVQLESGHDWHRAVLWAIDQGYGGIENLSLIPGKCGAAPMQNIGAYGIEIKDVLHSVTAIKKDNGLVYTFHNSECGFGYRSSYFKTKWKDQFIIVDIVLRLTKPGHHILNTSYGAIRDRLEEKGISQPTIAEVSETVIDIRQSKLPDPAEIGNAGSFFKNPVISQQQFNKLSSEFPTIPHYPAGEKLFKIPAAWLIDQDGWKGKVVGNTGTYKHQPLVLVNHGGASGEAVYNLSSEIKASVAAKYGVELEREVNVW